MKDGYRLAYVQNKEPAKSYREENQGIIFVSLENLNKVNQRLVKEWFHGDSSVNNGWFHNEWRIDYYFNDAGNFASVLTKPGTRFFIDYIEFVSSTRKGLEQAVKSFELPFDEQKIREDL